LHPPIERLLRQFGLAERFQSTVGARHSGIWLSWEGVQDSTYRMGLRALGAVPEISQITIAKPNKHYILINLSVFQLDNPRSFSFRPDRVHCRARLRKEVNLMRIADRSSRALDPSRRAR
jgi:hypothetical protein